MAAKKKDFTTANMDRVYTAIADATAEPEAQQAQQEPEAQQAAYTAEQMQEFKEAGKTQGRKGAKAVRFNMAFPPSVYEYITTMARVRGESVTKFTQFVFEQSMKDNAELYEQAKTFAKSFK